MRSQSATMSMGWAIDDRSNDEKHWRRFGHNCGQWRKLQNLLKLCAEGPLYINRVSIICQVCTNRDFLTVRPNLTKLPLSLNGNLWKGINCKIPCFIEWKVSINVPWFLYCKITSTWVLYYWFFCLFTTATLLVHRSSDNWNLCLQLLKSLIKIRN